MAPNKVVNSCNSGFNRATSAMNRFKVTPTVSQTSSKTGALGPTLAPFISLVATLRAEEQDEIRKAGLVVNAETALATRKKVATTFILVFLLLSISPNDKRYGVSRQGGTLKRPSGKLRKIERYQKDRIKKKSKDEVLPSCRVLFAHVSVGVPRNVDNRRLPDGRASSYRLMLS